MDVCISALVHYPLHIPNAIIPPPNYNGNMLHKQNEKHLLLSSTHIYFVKRHENIGINSEIERMRKEKDIETTEITEYDVMLCKDEQTNNNQAAWFCALF